MDRTHLRNPLLYSLCAVLCASLVQQQAHADDLQQHPAQELHYRTRSIDDAASIGTATILIQKNGTRLVVREIRHNPNAHEQTYDVVVDTETLLPLSWKLVESKEGKRSTTTVAIAKGKISARFEHADEVVVKESTLPTGEYVVVPMLKFKLAQLLERGQLHKPLHVIAVGDGRLDVIELSIEDKGVQSVTIDGKNHKCRQLRVGPASSLVAMLFPPGDMYLSEMDSHVMVLGIGRATRLSSSLRTELIKQITPSASVPPQEKQ